jgi:hypoxanthine phosphoribosyltransferase
MENRLMASSTASPKLVPLISQQEIAAEVQRLAGELDRDCGSGSPTLVGILRGSFIFLADLVRQMQTPLRSIEFMQMSSYGAGAVSSGRARVIIGLSREAVAGRDVIVVEDIVDTGITTSAVLRYLSWRQPASLRLCALLDKPSRRVMPVAIDYLGFTVPDRFLVGYGTDLDQRYRQLPAIYTLGE